MISTSRSRDRDRSRGDSQRLRVRAVRAFREFGFLSSGHRHRDRHRRWLTMFADDVSSRRRTCRGIYSDLLGSTVAAPTFGPISSLGSSRIGTIGTIETTISRDMVIDRGKARLLLSLGTQALRLKNLDPGEPFAVGAILSGVFVEVLVLVSSSIQDATRDK